MTTDLDIRILRALNESGMVRTQISEYEFDNDSNLERTMQYLADDGLIQVLNIKIDHHGRAVYTALLTSAGMRFLAHISDSEADIVAWSHNRGRFLRNLMRYFDDSELANICFELGLDYEDLSGKRKSDKAREMILLCERNGRAGELINKCRELRPNAEW